MTLIGILIALGLERVLGHAPGWGRPVIFLSLMRMLRALVPAVIWASPLLPLAVVAAPVALVWWAYGQIWSPLLALFASAAVLLLCLGPRDLAEDVHDLLAAREAGDIARVQQIARNLQRGPQPDESHRSLMGTLFIQSHEKLFGVLLFFFIFGPAGAVAYRIASRLPRLMRETAPASMAEITADWLHSLLAWVPVRVTTLLYGLAGSLDDAMLAWRGLLRQPQHGWRSHTWALLAEISVASLRVESADGATEAVNLGSALREVLRMQWRALLILLALFAIFATGGMF
ncbi:regulatory signaling modulator protein AmpE [Solimonas terrae]|uniref:Regulatory signaling modulator protein AmpE n=1 Tax=Solimonas terrae TaxID=1396819 RepID=A0A6M2BSE0_9GAMM|nr:regulatory signaling modulator protein AmpE [Solimonas terrae]NGY05516.1 regulatory signaling modulator protein AmpE [Solimonas terrae]